MGSITVNRGQNQCGKDSLMDIIITDSNGQITKGTVTDGGSTTVQVPDGNYKVYVEQAVQSNIVDVNINNNAANFNATITPVPGQLAIKCIDLK